MGPGNAAPIDGSARLAYSDESVANQPPEIAIPDDLAGEWWVAHTKPRNEKALAGDLRVLNIFSYLPLRHRQTRSRNTGRISRSLVPVFTGYLFFNATEEQRHRALTTNRIANVLAVPAQDRLVGELRQIQKVLVCGSDFQWHDELKPGDWARVISGPLVGVEGVVARRMSRLVLVLNVQMLGQSVSVRVTSDVLEKIDPPAYGA